MSGASDFYIRDATTPFGAALALVATELDSAMGAATAMNSPHEGWAVIKEELDELWEHVRANTGQTDEALEEAIQVAVMGLRYAIDLCDVL